MSAPDLRAASRHAIRLADKLQSASDHLVGPGLDLFRHELRGAAQAAGRLGLCLDPLVAQDLADDYVRDLIGPEALDGVSALAESGAPR